MTDKQDSSVLPLPLSYKNDAQGLALNRKSEAVEEIKIIYRTISHCHRHTQSNSSSLSTEATYKGKTAIIARCQQNSPARARLIHNASRIGEQSITRLKDCAHIQSKSSTRKSNDAQLTLLGILRHRACARMLNIPTKLIAGKSAIALAPAVIMRHCLSTLYSAGVKLMLCTSSTQRAKNIAQCRITPIPSTQPVPCLSFSIPEKPIPPNINPSPPPLPNPTIPSPPPPPCKQPERNDFLPLLLHRFNTHRDSAYLPLPLTCNPINHKKTRPPVNPAQRGYIMHHYISATINQQPIDPISINLTADMDGYCWQGSLELTPKDFNRLEIDSITEGNESVLQLDIDGYKWSLMLEQDYRDNRRHAAHGGHSYSVTLRSLTAKLGADYASTQQGIITAPLYARQIADQQLELLPFNITKWEIADWLVPENTYAITGKTPIAVISDIAQCAGGFISSHRTEPTLHVLPRWKQPAWISTNPDHTTNVVLAISGQKRHGIRYNSVRIIPANGGTGGNIYRQGSDTLPRHEDITHPLYTDQPAWIAKGTQVLSDSGSHKIETVELTLGQQTPLAELGQSWQIQEPNAVWQGVVQAIAISAKIDNSGAPIIRQTLTLDRYLGD